MLDFGGRERLSMSGGRERVGMKETEEGNWEEV